MKPSEYVFDHRINYPFNTNKMQKYDINGHIVKTNLGADNFPYWNGCGGNYASVPFGKTCYEVFDELVEQGYTKIRFVLMSTMVRGFTKMYYRAERSDR